MTTISEASAAIEQVLKKKPRAGITPRRQKAIVRRILALQDKGRSTYAKADDLTQLLIATVPTDHVIEVPEGRYAIVDNFGNGQNVAFRQARVKRFELKKLAKLPTKPAKPDPEDQLPS